MTPDALAALHARCFRLPPPWSADAFAGMLELPGCVLLTDDTGAAFLLGRALAGEAEVLTLAVAPEARRRGIARALLDRFETAARAAGADGAFLEVAADNLAARALYAAQGYAEAGRRKGYYSAPGQAAVDALVLSKTLTAN